ncbi:MAG: HDOD domain-containing protein [Nitrospinaceae bacterium]
MVLEAERLVEGAVPLASLPMLYYQVSEAVEDPETSFMEIGDIISQDSALTARLLRIVNSSFFGFSSKVETITHAVTIVGMLQLRDLVLATTIIGYFRGLPKNVVNMESFWRHSIASGLAARVIAIYRKEPNPERFYVCGLLHDLGRLLLFMAIPEDMKRTLEKYLGGGQLLFEAERDVLGLDHAEVGGALLKKWKLPSHLADAVRLHHQPSEAPEESVEPAITHLADIIAHSLQLGSSGERYVPPLDSQAWEKIGLPSHLLPAILNQVDQQSANTVQMFL